MQGNRIEKILLIFAMWNCSVHLAERIGNSSVSLFWLREYLLGSDLCAAKWTEMRSKYPRVNVTNKSRKSNAYYIPDFFREAELTNVETTSASCQSFNSSMW